MSFVLGLNFILMQYEAPFGIAGEPGLAYAPTGETFLG
jgi:hypothetical protein